MRFPQFPDSHIRLVPVVLSVYRRVTSSISTGYAGYCMAMVTLRSKENWFIGCGLDVGTWLSYYAYLVSGDHLPAHRIRAVLPDVQSLAPGSGAWAVPDLSTVVSFADKLY